MCLRVFAFVAHRSHGRRQQLLTSHSAYFPVSANRYQEVFPDDDTDDARRMAKKKRLFYSFATSHHPSFLAS